MDDDSFNFSVTGLTGDLYINFGSAIVVFIFGIVMLILGINLYNKMDINSAKLFYGSVFYLTLIQIVYIIDKFL